jgi:TolA-binding protein
MLKGKMLCHRVAPSSRQIRVFGNFNPDFWNGQAQRIVCGKSGLGLSLFSKYPKTWTETVNRPVNATLARYKRCPTVPDFFFQTWNSARDELASSTRRLSEIDQSGIAPLKALPQQVSVLHVLQIGLRQLLLVLLIVSVVFSVPAARAETPEDVYLLAAGYYKKERFTLASQQFQKFIKLYPTNTRVPTARFFLGLSQINERNYKDARETLRTFLTEAPSSPNAPHASYRVAECSYLLDDLTQAEPELNAFLSQYATDPLADRAMPYLGDVELRRKKVDQALQTFRNALEKFPKGPMAEDCEFGLAKCFEAKKDIPAAVAIYTRLAANTASERAPEAQLNLGYRLYDQGKFADAAVAFERVGTTFPQSPLISVARLNLGFSLFETHEYQKAAEQFALAEKDPQQAVEAGFWRSQCYKSLGNHQLAVQILKPLSTPFKPNKLSEKIFYHLADSQFHLGQFPEAQAAAAEYVSRFPKGELADEASLLACRAAIESGNVADSEKQLTQFSKTYSQSPLASQTELLRGRLLLMKGETAAAVPVFEKVIKDSDKESTKNSARYYIGYAQLELGHPEAAMLATDDLAEAVEKDPAALSFAGVYLLRAAGQLALGNKEPIANSQRELYAGAMDSASLFLQKAPLAKEVDQALAIRALAAAHAGQKDRAKGDVDTLSKDYANSSEFGKTLYEVAEVAYANNDWTWSEELFSRLAAIGKSSKFYVPGVSGQAWSLQQRKQFVAAGNLFTKLSTEYPEHKDAPEWAFMRAKTLQADGKPAEAIPLFEAVLKRYPKAKFAYLAGLEGARLYRDAGKYAEADKAYSAVLEKFPKPDNLDKILNEWALSNYEGKNYARSDEVFARLAAEAPDSELADNARLSLAESELVAGKLESARTKFQALSKDPKSDPAVRQTAMFQLLGIATELRNWDEVRQTADTLMSSFPMSKHFWYAEMRRAEADLNSMQVAKAVERLQKIIAQKDQPDSTVATESWFGQAWILLAEAFSRDKKYDDLAQTVAACRAWNPDFPSLYILDEITGRSLKAQGKLPEAMATVQRIVDDKNGRRTETAAKAQFMIGEISLLQKDYEKAEVEFLKLEILYKFPGWQAPALFQAGGCQEEMQHWKDAWRSYDALIKKYPKSEYAKMALEKLPRVKQLAANQ